MTDAKGETCESVEETSHFVMAQLESIVHIFGEQYLEGSAQSVSLHFTPKATLVTRDTVHDVERYVVEMGGYLLGQCFRLISKQNVLVKVPLEVSKHRDLETRTNELRLTLTADF